MSLDAELLKILACPACKSSLAWNERESFLTCAACARRFPVIDGIPDLTV